MSRPWSVVLRGVGLTEHVRVDSIGASFVRFAYDTHGVLIAHDFRWSVIDAERRRAIADYAGTRLAE
jgi:hypothetical protein